MNPVTEEVTSELMGELDKNFSCHFDLKLFCFVFLVNVHEHLWEPAENKLEKPHFSDYACVFTL